jgi:hypothetical protein
MRIFTRTVFGVRCWVFGVEIELEIVIEIELEIATETSRLLDASGPVSAACQAQTPNAASRVG